MDEWRSAQFNKLSKLISSFKSLDDLMESMRSRNSIKIAPHVNLAAHLIGGESMCWPDVAITSMLIHGAQPLGRQANVGVFQSRAHEASGTIEDSLAYSAGLLNSLNYRKPPAYDQRKAIFEKTLEEQNKGIVSKFYDKFELDELFGSGRWGAITRFAIWQKEKYRMIDNGKQGPNWTYESSETIFTSSAPHAAAAVRTLRELAGTRLRGKFKLNGSSRDMKAAYKQIPMDAMHASLTVIIVYDIRANRWRFVISHALLFGLSGAVLQFNRVPTFIVALARRWLAIITHAFFDDFRIIDFDCERQSAARWFDKLVELLGWTFDKEKAQTSLNVLPMLGNLERYSDIGFSESLIVEAKPERLRDMEDLIDTVLANRECLSGTAASIRGRSLHLSLTRPGKTGRLPIPSIDAIAESREFGWSEGLEADLLFLRRQLAAKHIRKYRLINCITEAPRMWSDASYSIINGKPFMRICCICATTSAARGIVYDTNDAFFQKLCTRKSQIAVGELMGVMVNPLRPILMQQVCV